MKKIEPSVYRSANLRAEIIKTGRYIAAIIKQRIPIPMQPINPKIRCFFDNLGQNGSDSASESQEDPPSLL
jgi:hypothetical protein